MQRLGLAVALLPDAPAIPARRTNRGSRSRWARCVLPARSTTHQAEGRTVLFTSRTSSAMSQSGSPTVVAHPRGGPTRRVRCRRKTWRGNSPTAASMRVRVDGADPGLLKQGAAGTRTAGGGGHGLRPGGLRVRRRSAPTWSPEGIRRPPAHRVVVVDGAKRDSPTSSTASSFQGGGA